jgi:hypothetical protein
MTRRQREPKPRKMNESQKSVGKTLWRCLVPVPLLLLAGGLCDWAVHDNSFSVTPRGRGEFTRGATTAQNRRLLSPVTNQEFEQCIETLEKLSGNDEKVGMDEYIMFLEMYSGRELSLEDFQDLPAPFVLIFYTAACSFGDVCDSEEEPTISLSNLEDAGAEGVLYMFCQSVKTVSAVQLTMKFQLQIRHVGNDETSIEEILMDSERTEVIQALEDVTEKVLLHRFGCRVDSRRRTLKNIQSARDLVQNAKGRLATVMTHAQRPRQLEPFDLYQYRPSSDICDYNIKALVQTIRPLGESTKVSFPRKLFY